MALFPATSVKRHLWVAALTVALALLAFPAVSQAQSRRIVVAVEDDAAPWSRANGTGYANDVVRAAFRAVGLDVEFRVMPYARCKRMAMEGEVAACFSMSPSEEIRDTIALSAQPIFTCYAGYFYNVDRPPHVFRQADFPLHTVVGTVIGYEYPPAFTNLIREGVVVPEESTSENLNLKKLAMGRIDLALLTYNETKTADWLISKAGVTGRVKVGFRAGILKSYIGFSRRNPDGLWALGEFNRGYRLIAAMGTLRHIRRIWSQKLARQDTSDDR